MTNNDIGFYMVRKCGYSYEYCNGRCNICPKSTHPINYPISPSYLSGYKYIKNNTGTTNGTPR